MSELMEMMNEEELDEVTGGNDSTDGGAWKGKVKVINGDGTSIYGSRSTLSKILGNYNYGTILNHVKDAGKGSGPDGFRWYSVPPQRGKSSGYVPQHFCKKLK